GSVWEVSSDSLTSAMVTKMQRSLASNAQRVPCTRGGISNFTTVIHRLRHPAEVMAEIDCTPTTALPYAEFSIEHNSVEVMRRSPASESWQCEINAGVYELRARFP